MSPKLITFFIFALVLSSTISRAARLGPASREVDSHQHEVVENEKPMEVDESCEGIGEDECLMRRTLAAHTDYLYTQDKKN